MTKKYTTEYACQLCTWRISRFSSSELGAMADEEEVELIAAEHMRSRHPVAHTNEKEERNDG